MCDGRRLTAGGTRKPPLPAMAKAVTQYSDVFVLAVGPKSARPGGPARAARRRAS